MNPEIAAIVDRLPKIDRSDIAEARARLERFAASKERLRPAEIEVSDAVVPQTGDTPPVPVRIYRPRHAQDPPLFIYIHGGGFTVGSLDTEDDQCVKLALRAGCCVVSPDYRLAPEHPYPAAVEDCYAVLEWAAEHAADFGADADRIGVGGTSAGGCLSAALCQLARDRQSVRIAFQMLVYPVLDDRLETTSSRQFTDTPIFDRGSAEEMWGFYLGDPRPEPTPPYAAPARAESLAGLPPAFVLAAGLDPLRDEAIEYALRLQDAGVETELHVVPAVPHGYVILPPEAGVILAAEAECAAVVRAALGSEDLSHGTEVAF